MKGFTIGISSIILLMWCGFLIGTNGNLIIILITAAGAILTGLLAAKVDSIY